MVLNSYIFINGVDIYKFKVKDYELNASPLFWDNVSKELSVDGIKKTGLYEHVYDFSVDYDTGDLDDNLHIHKYIMNMRQGVAKI